MNKELLSSYKSKKEETSWRKLISEAIDRVYDRMIVNTPPASEDERMYCEATKEAVKGMFLKESRSEVEAEFIVDNITQYEEIFEICMNGNNLQFKKGLIELQRMQNEYILEKESGIS